VKVHSCCGFILRCCCRERTDLWHITPWDPSTRVDTSLLRGAALCAHVSAASPSTAQATPAPLLWLVEAAARPNRRAPGSSSTAASAPPRGWLLFARASIIRFMTPVFSHNLLVFVYGKFSSGMACRVIEHVHASQVQLREEVLQFSQVT